MGRPKRLYPLGRYRLLNGGDYIQLGPFFQTYMYAFMIGYHLGVCNPIKDSGETRDFAPISQWKPMEISDYVRCLSYLNQMKN